MAVLFNITHDANNLDEYDSTVTDGGDLSTGTPGLASTTAKMECLIDDTNSIYGQIDISAPASGHLRFRAYIDPNGLEMAEADMFYWIDATGPGGAGLFSFRLLWDGSVYKSYVKVNHDAGSETHFGTLTDDEHYIEIHIERGTGDGRTRLWIDGVITGAGWDNLDNDERYDGLEKIRVGCPYGLDAGTSGTLHIDEIKANDDGGEIGPVSVVRIPRYGFTNFQVPGVV